MCTLTYFSKEALLTEKLEKISEISAFNMYEKNRALLSCTHFKTADMFVNTLLT